MSYDLAIWHSDEPLTADQADSIYGAIAEQPESAPVKAHPSIAAFYADLCAKYPDLDTLAGEEIEASPWAGGFDRSDAFLMMNLSWGDRLEEAAAFVAELAAKHRLVCYDPQGQNVYLPPGIDPAG